MDIYLLGKELRIFAAKGKDHKQQKLVKLGHSVAPEGPRCTAANSAATVVVNRVA